MAKSHLYALVLVLWIFVQVSLQAPDAPYPASVQNDLAQREMREHHLYFHQTRNLWLKFNSKTKQGFTNLQWNCPRPSKSYNSNGDSEPESNNNSGEDFFYMHRQMIAEVNSWLEQAGSSERVNGWTSLPAPGDKDYPVPPEYTIPGQSSLTSQVNDYKSDDFYNNYLKPEEAYLKNPANLRKMTLGQLGSRVEMGVHNALHLRFSAASSYGYREQSSNPVATVSTKWDNVNYSWLVDKYAAHVNPIFWKIHGWCDDRINDWQKANNLSSITWTGKWVGGPLDNMANLTNAYAG